MSGESDAVAQALAKTVASRIEQSRTTTQRGLVTAVGTDGVVSFSVGTLGTRVGMYVGLAPEVGDVIVYVDEGKGLPLVLGKMGGDQWKSYTPTWTNGGGAPSLGNGSTAGRYLRHGNTLHIQQSLIVGSTSTVGSGQIRLSLPSGMVGTGMQSTGSGYWLDASTGIFTPAVSILDPAATFIYGWIGTGTSPGDAAGLGSGDAIHHGGTFQIA